MRGGPRGKEARALLIGSPFFTHALQGLRSRQSERRITALHALARLDGAEVVRPLLSQLEAEEEEVREEAAKALSSLKDERAVELILSLWRDHPLDLVAEALVRHGPTIIPQVGPLVTHADPLMRFWAVEVLKRLKATEGAPFLLDGLLDPQVAVRANAARALGEVGSKDLSPLMTLLRLDSAYEVRVQAAESLMKVGDKAGMLAVQEAFLNLGAGYFPWDAAVQLWKTFVRCLKQAESLSDCLGRASTLPVESLRRWLGIGVTARDIETLTVALHYVPEQAQEITDALARAVVMHGEEAILQDVVQQLSRPGIYPVAALKALRGLSFSSSSTARLSAELGPLLQSPEEEVRSGIKALMSRWGESWPESPEAKQNVRVSVVHECKCCRLGLRIMLELEGVEVVGEAGSAEEGESMVTQLPPDAVVFCSTSLPDFSRFLEQLNKQYPTVAVVFIIEEPGSEVPPQALKGRRAALTTRLATAELCLDALRSVATGASSAGG